MLSPSQEDFLRNCVISARESGHIFPEMAACEAAVETGWGTSQLAKYNNLFGTKQHEVPIYETISLPTHEVEHGIWKVETASWVKYPDLPSCFKDRMETLRRLADSHPDYALALASDSPVEFVTEISKTWSTDPERAQKCISIFNSHKDILGA